MGSKAFFKLFALGALGGLLFAAAVGYFFPSDCGGCKAPAAECVGQIYPPFIGSVSDAAEILSNPAEARLTALSNRLRAKTRHQMVVVTVNTLQGRDISAFTRCLGNHWGVGRKGVNDGVIILVAPKEYSTRIAVGEGLVNSFTNIEAQKLVEDVMIPAFRDGNYAVGIERASEAAAREIGG